MVTVKFCKFNEMMYPSVSIWIDLLHNHLCFFLHSTHANARLFYLYFPRSIFILDFMSLSCVKRHLLLNQYIHALNTKTTEYAFNVFKCYCVDDIIFYLLNHFSHFTHHIQNFNFNSNSEYLINVYLSMYTT